MNGQRTLKAGVLTVKIELTDGKLEAVTLPARIPGGLDATMLADLIAQLAEFPCDFSSATTFTRRVWDELRRIPAGTARTYGELATAIGKPRATRAVGRACGANPRLLIVPCHRVVAAEGLGGFASGLDWKRKLLELET